MAQRARVHNHFDQHLNVKELILAQKPGLVVECGAGSGENTRKLAELRKECPFRLVVINDGCDENIRQEMDALNVLWVEGISYVDLNRFANGEIGVCVIDTDHNYWTLRQELEVLRHKMRSGGIVAIHDTDSPFGESSGHMIEYAIRGVRYPANEILRCEEAGKVTNDAIREAVSSGAWTVERATVESCGAMALRKT